MTFSLLTYNVLYNKAFTQLENILSEHQPDIVCLQEVETSERNLTRLYKFGYTLADYSNSFIKVGKIYGIATYFNSHRLKLVQSDSYILPRSLYEMFSAIIRMLRRKDKPRTILRTDFKLEKSSKTVAIYNVHLTLFGINRTRTKQLEIILNHGLKDLKLPVVITGDFNYFPYRRKRLEKLMSLHGFKEATRNINYSVRFPDRKFAKYSWFQEFFVFFIRKYFNNKLKPDYTFFKNLKVNKTERIDVQFSDHYPIICNFELV